MTKAPQTAPSTSATGTEDEIDVTVGPVNTSFAPLEPDDIVSTAASSLDTEATEDDGRQESPERALPPLMAATNGHDDVMLGCLRDMLLVLVSVLLASAFIFGILFILNGTLLLNDREKVTQLALAQSRLQTQLSRHESQLAAQKEALATVDARILGLEDRIESLETQQKHQQGQINALQARADEIEQAAEVTRQQLGELQMQHDNMVDNVAALEKAITEMRGFVDETQANQANGDVAARRFDLFIEGLRKLIAEVSAEESNLGTPGPTTSATPPLIGTPLPEAKGVLTPTITLTSTITLSPTETMTATEPLTSSLDVLELFPPSSPLPTPSVSRGVIYGVIWQDANANGAPDPGELPARGVLVSLQDAHGNPLLNMITGEDGRFVFINMPPGHYRVAVVPAPTQILTTDNPQSVGIRAGDRLEINFGVAPP